MRVLVTGSSSLPGFRIWKIFEEKGGEVLPLCFEHRIKNCISLDITSSLSPSIINFKPEVIIHTAAYGDVDGCEVNKERAYRVNVLGTLNVFKLAREASSFLIYLSTDYVFDGERGDYKEYDIPNPVNYYGLTKLLGEAIVSSGEGAIVRASSIYGFGSGRSNFAKFLFERLSKGEKVKALVDQFTTPTQASLLAEAIYEIAKRGIKGVHHVVGEKMSRFEFAITLAKALSLNEDLIDRAKMEEFNWKAKRPRDSSLSCSFTMERLSTDFHSKERAMEALKKELLKEYT